MTDPPETSPSLIAYQIKELQRTITALGEAMKHGFEQLERKLDDRLASRDARLDDLEQDQRATERRLDRKDGRDAMLAWILGLFATSTVGGLVALFWEVFRRGGL